MVVTTTIRQDSTGWERVTHIVITLSPQRGHQNTGYRPANTPLRQIYASLRLRQNTPFQISLHCEEVGGSSCQVAEASDVFINS